MTDRSDSTPVHTPPRPPTLLEDLDTRFTYHTPKPGQPEIYQAIRNEAKNLATLIAVATPQSREQALAITHLEEAVFWANAAVARRS